MRGMQIGILAIGLALAGFGVYMAQSYVSQTQAALAAAQQRSNAGQPAIPTVQVMVAARPLRYGEPVTADAVRAIAWPAASVPAGAMQSLEAVVPDPNRPRIALRAMEPAEPILAVKVSEPGQSAGIAAMLTPGLRAFTIRVDQNSGISGTLRPTNTVDIYWTGRGEEGEVTRLLSTGVKIIALDENADLDRTFNGVPRSVTIEAAPEVVATLAQGQSTGRLSLSLVGLDDTSAPDPIQVDRRGLLGIEDTPEAAAPERCTVRTRRGSEVVLIEIPCTN